MNTREAVIQVIEDVIYTGNLLSPNQWQAVKGNFEMIELSDYFIQMDICETWTELVNQTGADLPWSENHFIERLQGASNPGEEYKNWPYYSPEKHDSVFRQGDLFSHTYQERFWPPSIKGIRYNMGNYNDIKERLKKDPTTRQAFFSIWHPEDQSNNDVRLPCTIGYWFTIKQNKLNITYLIRSCDMARHFRNDVFMTQRLAADMRNHVDPNLELGTMSMWIGSAHCFKNDLYYLKQKIKKCAELQ